MSDEDDKKLEALNQSFNDKLSVWGSVVLGFLGAWFFGYYALAYVNMSYIPYVLIYGASLVFLFFSFKRFKLLNIIGLMTILGLTLLISMIKINWEKSYYEGDVTFLMAAHVEKLPAWEVNLLAPLIGSPDWFRFNTECAEPALYNQPFRDECKSLSGIEKRYNLSVKKELDDYLYRMRHTAGLINKRGSLTAPQYKGCIQQRQCAQIPMLPADVTEDTIDPENERHARVSRVFWDLVEAKPLNRDMCAYIDLCQVLERSGAISFD